MLKRLLRVVTSIHGRVLVLNALVLFVPFAGVEFANIYERQLLQSLERDMRDQAILVASIARHSRSVEGWNLEIVQRIVTESARRTRTRIRLLDRQGAVRADSHLDGPPEGEEDGGGRDWNWTARLVRRGQSWPDLEDRIEVRQAFEGHPSAHTRIRERTPSVILFVAEPVRRPPVDNAAATEARPREDAAQVEGVVYVTRSTQPVLEELHYIRDGLVRLLLAASAVALAITLFLTFSITRPLTRLARAARSISLGTTTNIPLEGPPETRHLGRALTQLVRSLEARMRYIRDFTADIAHEFKSPITAISGSAELLSENNMNPVDRARFVANIRSDAERLDRWVDRLLELSRIEASAEPFALVDLDQMIARVIERLATDEQPVIVSGAGGTILARSNDLERALINLVENALHASPPKVAVRIGMARECGNVRIAVSDRGLGVPPAHRARLFERFFTTRSDEGGTGLGLSIVRSVARAHGGDAFLDPQQEIEGARMVLVLPIRD